MSLLGTCNVPWDQLSVGGSRGHQRHLFRRLWQRQSPFGSSRIVAIGDHRWHGLWLCPGKILKAALRHCQILRRRLIISDRSYLYGVLFFYPLGIFSPPVIYQEILQHCPAVPWNQDEVPGWTRTTCGSLECLQAFQVERGNKQCMLFL